MSTTANSPASPLVPPPNQLYFEGLTKREHFAAVAMAGLLADHKDHSDECADGETCPKTVARLSVEHADALIEALNKQ